MRIFVYCALIVMLFSCKNNKSDFENLPVSERIAKAHGFDSWEDIAQIDFTFNVDKDDSHFERSWSWQPDSRKVVLTVGENKISYNRSKIDSVMVNADKSFVNDKYWLLAPFNLIWDKEIKQTYTEETKAPISKVTMQKLTIVYEGDGGYTPGDAYDFYFGEDYLIKEWAFRKENSAGPGLITTWEDYEEFDGLQIATTHNKKEGNWKLYFTDIETITKD
ncbi:hypothetical protein [Ascidiimonas sp. W6]|uniref:hypothetical protein n=1 Tax=Ascidiimonas meishanensis TaxID=3128903 RepID=UPI0030EB9190